MRGAAITAPLYLLNYHNTKTFQAKNNTIILPLQNILSSLCPIFKERIQPFIG